MFSFFCTTHHTSSRSLTGLPDVERLCRRLEARKLGLPELCHLYRASAALPYIEDVLRSHEGPHADVLVKRWDSRVGWADGMGG